ncbi:hypothetical protein NXS98_07290 [Fontisphaera persica]|uniref:hypothetical protein n=1 Tax=Fontisphaera persica TaxID=2974023 RepID=UPI0024BFBDF4|nr:hypothetical protein [Fontisphaera persica]WCJ60916.1 hypothetical protein NXS98_07290 [Fontisphaera persica]
MAAIAGARRLVVFAAPGVSNVVAEALSEAWRRLGAQGVRVILDVDAEVCRLGYGTMEGLQRLQTTAQSLGTMVCEQPGLRLGLLVVDEKVLIYSPTPLLIEAGSSQDKRPNCLVLMAYPTRGQ